MACLSILCSSRTFPGQGREKVLFHLILNAYWEPLKFELPPLDLEYGPCGADGSTRV
jgi:hypothetical protein